MRYKIFTCFLLAVFVGCKPEAKKEAVLVKSMVSPAENGSCFPFLFSNGDKTLLSWMEKTGDSLTELKYSELVDGAWQSPKKIVQGSDWFVNWADFPVIAEQKGNMISHILEKSSADVYSYDVKLNLRRAGETEWKTNLSLHTDGTPTEHGFVTVVPYNDGFFVTWLDGRNTIQDKNGNHGAMTIRAAEITPTGKIRNETELDKRACDCCQTTAAITEKGPVVMYRDRSEGEVRDISIVRWENGRWTAPKTVYFDNWQIKGCPVNGPKAAVLGDVLTMAWFTAANEKPKVQVLFSMDGGSRFDTPIVVAETNTIGRVDVLMVDELSAIVSWVETHDGIARLKAVKVNRDGTKGNYHVISEMDASRQSGFPQMERVGDKVYFAWTATDNITSKIKTNFVELHSF